MNDIAIRVEGLGKRYKLGALDPYKTLRDQVAGFWRGRGGRERAAPPKEIWALRDLSFEVTKGEVLGIIGRNGAGKSTLLKILSQITRPSEGRAEIHGRVGALLEVGTGFHMELTGRENVYMNGSILGMGRAEIDRKFDEIVDFAGVEDFLETPVKRYSSGMRVRLAFAVAAHLEPDILIVDEVLAVGDAGFQRKCLGRMSEVATEGRTVLFVSHQMESILNLCSRAIWLDDGRILENEATEVVVRDYLHSMQTNTRLENIADRSDREGSGDVRITNIELRDGEGRPQSFVTSGRELTILLRYHVIGNLRNHNLLARIVIANDVGRILCRLDSGTVFKPIGAPGEDGALICNIPYLPLVPGRYFLGFSLWVDQDRMDKLHTAFVMDVNPSDAFGTGGQLAHAGLFICPSDWQINRDVDQAYGGSHTDSEIQSNSG